MDRQEKGSHLVCKGGDVNLEHNVAFWHAARLRTLAAKTLRRIHQARQAAEHRGAGVRTPARLGDVGRDCLWNGKLRVLAL